MYLLGAIERLVYRVDLMEKRMRRTEELLYHLMEGTHTHREGQQLGFYFVVQTLG